MHVRKYEVVVLLLLLLLTVVAKVMKWRKRQARQHTDRRGGAYHSCR